MFMIDWNHSYISRGLIGALLALKENKKLGNVPIFSCVSLL